jgi:hypothetical protein
MQSGKVWRLLLGQNLPDGVVIAEPIYIHYNAMLPEDTTMLEPNLWQHFGNESSDPVCSYRITLDQFPMLREHVAGLNSNILSLKHNCPCR